MRYIAGSSLSRLFKGRAPPLLWRGRREKTKTAVPAGTTWQTNKKRDKKNGLQEWNTKQTISKYIKRAGAPEACTSTHYNTRVRHMHTYTHTYIGIHLGEFLWSRFVGLHIESHHHVEQAHRKNSAREKHAPYIFCMYVCMYMWHARPIRILCTEGKMR